MRSEPHSCLCDKKDGRGAGVLYSVLMEMEEKKGDRWLRLGDLAADEVMVGRSRSLQVRGKSMQLSVSGRQRSSRL